MISGYILNVLLKCECVVGLSLRERGREGMYSCYLCMYGFNVIGKLLFYEGSRAASL